MSDGYDQAITAFLPMVRNQFFWDVNKRTGRFAMNGILLSNSFPVINLNLPIAYLTARPASFCGSRLATTASTTSMKIDPSLTGRTGPRLAVFCSLDIARRSSGYRVRGSRKAPVCPQNRAYGPYTAPHVIRIH